jgi:N-acetylmuramoyl-L-alanine amidase
MIVHGQKLEWNARMSTIGVMLRFCRFYGLVLLALVGCQSPSQLPVSVTTMNTPPRFVLGIQPPPAQTSAPPVTVVAPPPLTNTVVAKPTPVWPSNWVNTWIPLQSWSQFNGMQKITQHGSNQAPAFDLHASNAVMSLKVGSKVVRYNGLECWLGYTPQMIKGKPYIHSLDAQKNLQPLLEPTAYEFKTNRTVVIDPGHGGKDSGTRNVNGPNFEKEYTLDWALRLRSLLESNGWKVVLTRTNDVDLSLTDRIGVAERVKADLFISLHFNSGTPNRELAGLETYCLTPTGMPSSLVRTYEDDIKQSFPNNAFDEQNYQFAYRVHRELVQSLGVIDRGIRRARFMSVLRGQNRPAVLIEGGYLSNPTEARKIGTPHYRQALAEAVSRAMENETTEVAREPRETVGKQARK